MTLFDHADLHYPVVGQYFVKLARKLHARKSGSELSLKSVKVAHENPA